MTTRIYRLEDEILDELVEEVTSLPQPLYQYYYESDGLTYLLVSTVEIPEEDQESVSEDLINDLEDYDGAEEDGYS